MKHNLISVQENNLFRNKVTKIVRKQKSNFRKALFLKCQGNLKKTWHQIYVILSKNTKNNLIKNILYNNDADITEVFNSFFCSIGQFLFNFYSILIDKFLPFQLAHCPTLIPT